MGTAEITVLIRDALVARGFLVLEEAECVYVRKDLGGMEEMGYAPDSYKTLPQ